MARLPLVPKKSTIGGFAFLLFLMVLMGMLLYFSFAAGSISADEQIRIQAVVAGVLVVLGGVAAFFFFLASRERG